MGSPTYGKYAVQNFVNIADLSPNLGKLAGDFMQLWLADAAQAFLPSSGTRGGAHNRVYRDGAFFNRGDVTNELGWLYGWWKMDDSTLAKEAMEIPQMTLFATSKWQPLPIITAIARSENEKPFLYRNRRPGDVTPCDEALGPTCKKLPCKKCSVCGAKKALAFDGSGCYTLKTPTTVIKREWIGAKRLWSLGSITLNVSLRTNVFGRGDMPDYVADVGQNFQIGALLGGANMGANGQRNSRLLFGDSGSTNCSNPSFQRHSYFGMTSALVPGAVAVARPVSAKINGCNMCKPGSQGLGKAPCVPKGECKNTDFPLWAFVSADLYASRTVAGAWTCFNGADETYGCVGLAGPGALTASPPCFGPGAKPCKTPTDCAPGFWNGTLLLFNGSSTSRSIGVMQMGSKAEHGSFGAFVKAMEKQPIGVDADGALRYKSLAGDVLRLGVGGITLPKYESLAKTYDSPHIQAKHRDKISVKLSLEGYTSVVLTFA